MNTYSKIKYLKHQQIDFEKWNAVLDDYSGSLLYAYTFYLNAVSPRWDALVYGDYEYIMPLTINKKAGISLLQQPPYCQQLGVFPAPSDEILKEFINVVKKKFSYAAIHFNSHNFLANIAAQGIFPLNNYLLSLNSSYSDIRYGYSSHACRHLKKAHKRTFRLTVIEPDVYLAFKTSCQAPSIYKNGLETMKRMLPEMLSRNKAAIYAVFDENNEICAAAVFLFDRKRIIYLNGVSSMKGKENDAMYFLLDNIIQRSAGQELFLDFEGSNIPGIARFFQGFGAKPEIYYDFKHNRLPIPLRWLKK